MAIELNQVVVAGNLTRDPETRSINDRMVATFTIAASRRYKVDGETREKTAFIDCEAWGKTAEIIGRFFTKGKPIIVQGRIDQQSWTDKETQKKRSKLLVSVDSFSFVPDGKRDQNAPSQSGQTQSAPTQSGPVGSYTGGDEEPPF